MTIYCKETNWQVVTVRPDLEYYHASLQNADDLVNIESLIRLSTNHSKQLKELTKLDEFNDTNNLVEMAILGKKLAGELFNQFSGFEHSPNLKYTNQNSYTKSWVAIVGIAGRFPMANDTDQFWSIFCNEVIGSKKPPGHRTRLSTLDPNRPANYLDCQIDQFDAEFFRMSPTETITTDPQARILLETSWEAFEDAGINPKTLEGTPTGVFHGCWMQEYKSFIEDDNIIRSFIGAGLASTAAKLSFFYRFTGPNVALDSACASSSLAVILAVKHFLARDCPLALACASNLILKRGEMPSFMSADGKSKSFDKSADGYARGECLAVLVLKRYSDAIRDDDNIHAVIRGTGLCQAAPEKYFDRPSMEDEYVTMRKALQDAKLDPSEVDYVEAYATGTPIGDPIEAAAIVKAYSILGKKEKPLYIASGKTNVGHTEASSGITGMIKVILAMKNEKIPKHVSLKTLNPAVDFSSIPGEIPLKAVPWLRNPRRPRIAGGSSFGFTGTATHIILQELVLDLKNQFR